MIRDPTVTKPENPATNAETSTETHATQVAKQAADGATVPNRPLAATAAADAPPLAEAADSVLVGTSKDDQRKPAKRKSSAGEESGQAKAAKAKAEDAPTVFASSSVPASGSSAKSAPREPAQPEVTRVETKVVEVRKAGFMPTLLGGVIAAGLGAGAAYYAIPHLPAAWQPVAPVAPLDPQAQLAAAQSAGAEAARAEFSAARPQLLSEASAAATDAAGKLLEGAKPANQSGDLSAFQTELGAQSDKIAALSSAVDALRSPAADSGAGQGSVSGQQPIGQQPIGGDSPELQALQSVVAQLRTQVEAQEARIADLAARPASDGASSAQLEALTQQAAQTQDKIAAAAQEAQAQIAAAQAEAERLKQETTEVSRRAQIAAAAAGLQSALESGGNLVGGIADLRAAGVEPPAALTQDVPALAYLQSDFDAAARSGLRASLKAQSQGEGTMTAIGNFLRVQTGARSIEAKDGGDPDAILSRAGAAVRAGDIAAALNEIATLPAPGQEAMAGWTAQAKRWSDARAALADLAATAK